MTNDEQHDEYLAVKAERRAQAESDFDDAVALADQHGMSLIQHSEAHYKLMGPPFSRPTWRLEVYPGNQRLYRQPGSGRERPPWLDLPKGRPWTLLDVVQAAARVIADKPEPESEEEPEWDYEQTCDCGQSPVLKQSGMCGVCTFGEAEMATP